MIEMQQELTSRNIVAAMDADLRQRVGHLKTEFGTQPSLAILSNNPNHAPSQKYIELKKRIAKGLGIRVATGVAPSMTMGSELGLEVFIKNMNESPHFDGIIVQLPLTRSLFTDEIVSQIAPEKDVDGLGPDACYPSATASAFTKLMDGYNIDYMHEPTRFIGRGRLANGPAYDILKARGAKDIKAYDAHSDRLEVVAGLNEARIIVSGMGQPGMLTSNLFVSLEVPRVLVDVGTSEQGGKLQGDVSDELRQDAMRNGWQITPEKGGQGPVTIRTLLSHTVASAERRVGLPPRPPLSLLGVELQPLR